MKPDTLEALRQLVRGRRSAALGTLREGAPFVSMVPYAVAADGGEFIVHVSRLAAHTQDMAAAPQVCLMICAPENPGVPAQALPRISIPGTARFVAGDAPEHAAMRAAYLDRFPSAEQMFSFADFSIVAIRPDSARYVAGFAQAQSMTAESLCRALASGE